MPVSRALLAAALCAAAAAVTRHPLLVIVSFDGFRPDYARPDVTPHLARFRDAGAAPPYMRNAFPTKTFVNHFTMATGVHPETHGVLDNYMFDRSDGTMHYTYEMFHYDDSVTPIWVRARRTGPCGRGEGVFENLLGFSSRKSGHFSIAVHV